MEILDKVIPVLTLAKASVTGIGIPAVEPVLNGVLELATMISTMRSNNEALVKLEICLSRLTVIDTADCPTDLKTRLTTLSSNLGAMSLECKSLREKHRINRFVMGKEYENRIEGMKTSITTHIRDFTFYGNISIEKAIADMAGKVNEVLTSEALARLKTVSARYNAENTPDICMEGTRVDTVQDVVTRLISPPDQSQRIVMLSGSAGSGKSTIAKTVASILAQKHGSLAASFFFARDHAERKELKFLPSTLARQLADYSSEFEHLLVKFLNDDRTDIVSAEPRLQFQILVVGLLATMPRSQTPWVICLDALDECGKDRGQILLRWLSDNIAQLPTHIRFFLTGRPDVPSYLKFDTLRSLMHPIVLDEIDSSTVEHDIRLYIAQSLDGSHWTTRDSWKAQDQDVDEITRRASGLFIFAATAVRYILSGLPQDHPQRSVDYLLKGAPLTDLDDLYFRIVEEAIPTPSSRDPRAQDSRERSMRILGTILHLFEPLDPQSLAALVDVDVDAIKRTLLPLTAVIRVPESEGTIRIIHLSFREFLTTSIQERRSDLLCGTGAQKILVASTVIGVLQKELKFNICDLPTSHLRNQDMPDLQWRITTYIPRHLQYCCQFWVHHLVSTPYIGDIDQQATKFLLDKFLFWLEVLSLLRLVGHAPSALAKFVAWTQTPSAARFAADARRFIAFFSQAIIQSTPHIYVSALALAPSGSEVRSQYHSQFPGLLWVKKGRMQQWPTTITVLEGHSDQVRSLAFTGDGRQIVSVSLDGDIRLWDAETGELLSEAPYPVDDTPLARPPAIRIPNRDVVHDTIAISPDGTLVICGGIGFPIDTIRRWEPARDAHMFVQHHGSMRAAAFSGTQVLSESTLEICVWEPKSMDVLHRTPKPVESHHRPQHWTTAVTCVAFSSDGSHIAFGAVVHKCITVCLWDVDQNGTMSNPSVCEGGKPTDLQTYNSKICSVSFSPGGTRVVCGGSDGTICVWDVKSHALLRVFKSPPFKSASWSRADAVNAVACSPDGNLVVSGSQGKIVRMWNITHGNEFSFIGHNGPVNAVAFSPDGMCIASGSGDRTIRVWNVPHDEQGDTNIEPEGDMNEESDTTYLDPRYTPTMVHETAGSWAGKSTSQDGYDVLVLITGASFPSLWSERAKWTLNLGWLTNGSELLFWLPSHHRPDIWLPEWPYNRSKSASGKQPIELADSTFMHGTNWVNCYRPLWDKLASESGASLEIRFKSLQTNQS
ncbi:hypothetical protein C8R46DRAFT_1117335 [Mycena filopes]|nr:hypothetical protein C8R46DRAFT_1117335 [Mycena filopes]